MKRESNSAPIPFSISPDAEDYLRDRLHQMPPGAALILMMTMSQTDGLNPPRWCYEGQSFVIGYFDSTEKTEVEYAEFKLFGRRLAVEPNALKQLSGQTLHLRRVASRYGWMKNSGYVLVANAAQEPPASDIEAMVSSDKARRVFSIAGLVILGGFTGIGVVWIIAGLVVAILRIPTDKFLPMTFPLFVAGWIAGAINSFFFFRFVYKTGGRTKFTQEQTERKYLGYGGLEANISWWVFLGIPIPITAVLILAFEPFARTVGQKSGVAVASLMVVFALSMYFSERLPRRLILGLGVVGWALTLALGYWYFKTHGP